MSWREDLRRVRIVVNGVPRDMIAASFRGVAFFVDNEEMSTGRRTVVHEFPLREDPFVEDMGRRARKFRIDGYIVGDDYLVQKVKLQDALETEGAGELVHPYHPVKRAIADSVSVRETRADGGMAVFAIDFIEAPVFSLTPTITVDTVGKVATSATAANVASRAELVEKFSASGLPGFALTSAESAIESAAAAVGDQLGKVDGLTQDIATLNSRVTLLTAQSSSLARSPGDAFDGFLGAVTSLAATAVSSPGDVFDALVRSYAAARDDVTAVLVTTTTRARELANQIALTGALQRVMAIEAARLAPLVPYDSIEEATAARDHVAALLEEQAATAGDTAYPALVTLRSDVLRAVPGPNVFARIVTVSRPSAIPSLLLAYQLYGSVDLELDVIARNRVRHPGFIAGDLQVLSDA